MKLVSLVAGPCWALLIAIVAGLPASAGAADPKPLRSVDTSSPRATLRSLQEIIDQTYVRAAGVIRSYAASDRLYLDTSERERLAEGRHIATDAVKCLDLSRTSPAIHDLVGPERLIQLKEILDRIEIPALEQIPDRNGMAEQSVKRWRLPDTEIDIVLVADGPRAGEYLFSADTVARLPEFYERVRNLPYKPGPAMELRDALRAVGLDQNETIYDAVITSPVALGVVFPIHWMLSLPGWATTRHAGLTAWQWCGLAFGMAVGAAFLAAVTRWVRRLAGRRAGSEGLHWHAAILPLAVIFVTGLFLPAVEMLLRIGDAPRIILIYVQTAAMFLSAAWLSIVVGNVVGELIVVSQHLRQSSLDGQLIRLGMRFVGILAAINFLIAGANELGFPAYSVLAGLGVGGLAVALAARDSLANLLGSIVIMFEKPFRIGHMIRIGTREGTVEDVGFRSTRIRTLSNSIISIPNSEVVNAAIENLSLRLMRRQRFFVQISYDTPRETLERFVSGISRLISDHPNTNKSSLHVRFHQFGESSLDILVNFFFHLPDYASELKEREVVLLQIMDLARDLGVEFAFPTRSIRFETATAPPLPEASLAAT